jgi:hypothetical protein
MTINRDLFLTILALDSYHCGYGQGTTGLSESGRLDGRALIRRARRASSRASPG